MRERALSRFKALGLFALLTAGIALMVTGVAMISAPLAVVVLGLCLVGIVVQEVYL